MTQESSLTGSIGGRAVASRRGIVQGDAWTFPPGPSALSSVAPGEFQTVVPVSPRELGSIAWALAPLISVGMAAGPCFAYAAVRRRSRAFALAALSYAAVSAAIVWNNVWSQRSQLDLNVGVLAVLLLWTVSSVHALAVRRSVFFDPVEEDAVVAARNRIRLRDESRRIVASDPRLARELRIGRPDQASDYDDGGLVDMNHVPEEYLRRAGVLDSDLVDRIMQVRTVVGRFDSLHDLEVTVGLEPRSLDEVADRMIFCR